MASSSSNVVGVHYRVGKKIGEGSFGVIFEGTNLLNNQQVAIKFVRQPLRTTIKLFISTPHPPYNRGTSKYPSVANVLTASRNLERATPHNYGTNTEHIKFLLAAVSIFQLVFESL
jgi:serine/threonine protein kinase